MNSLALTVQDARPWSSAPVRRLEQGEIRLLNLESTTPLRGSFTYVKLSEEPVYEAVSYAWGDPARIDSCEIDGVNIALTASAAHLLRHFNPTQPLWIDAICINQDDLEERSQQVAIMLEIYAQCQQCTIWLGEDNGQAESGFASIEMIAAFTEQNPDLFPEKYVFAAQVLSIEDGRRAHDWDLPVDTDALHWTFSKPWFSRKWTVQEVSWFDKTICRCGTAKTSVINLMRAAACIMGNAANKHVTAKLVDLVYPFWGLHANVYMRDPNALAMSALLALTRNGKVSEPRDAVFAILGLCRAAHTNFLMTPNYNKSVAEIFGETTKAAAIQISSFEILQAAYPRPENSAYDDIPSWIPLWHKSDIDILGKPRGHMPDIFRASAGLDFDASRLGYDSDPLTLQCKCTVIDTIHHVHSNEGVRDAEWWRGRIRWVWDQALQPGSPYESQLDKGSTKFVFETVALTLILDSSPRTGSHARYEDVENFMVLEAILKAKQPELDRLLNGYFLDNIFQHGDPNMERLYYGMNSVEVGDFRSPFVTARGVLGQGPDCMREGDLLVVLHGCPWPAIIRPVDDHFQFLEVCYARGYMMGKEYWPSGVDTYEMDVTLK